jgi:tripartite-type tricarboxylate transporter receptor subunit TctC
MRYLFDVVDFLAASAPARQHKHWRAHDLDLFGLNSAPVGRAELWITQRIPMPYLNCIAKWISVSMACTFAVLPLSSLAQAYPSKPVRWVVPWPAGGVADIAARQIANRLQAAIGQPIVIDNKIGAGGNIGSDFVAKSPADGYTLLFTTSGLTINSAMGSKMQFDAVKDLERVALVAHAPSVLVVQQENSVSSVADLVKLARAQPGKLSYASAGIGSPAHMTGELFKARQNLSVVHVPYTGAPAAMTDQIGGRVDYHFANVSVALPQIKAGKIRALAVTSPQRLTTLPQVPTMEEAGMGKFEAAQWLGLLAPKGTSSAVIEKWNVEINKVLAAAEFDSALANAGMTSAKPGSPQDFDAYFKQDLTQWSVLVKAANIKPE